MVRGRLTKIQATARKEKQQWAIERPKLDNARNLTGICFIVSDDKDFKETESGCAYNGITDVVTNLLMKVQHVTVSENSVHNSCVSLTVVWTWNFVLSRQT